jgi:predicted site-specific integrase-resolvase
MTTMNQSQYAQHSGVDRKTIGRWIKAGRFIVMDGDLIDVEASDAALKKNRDGKDPRASNAKKKKTPSLAITMMTVMKSIKLSAR